MLLGLVVVVVFAAAGCSVNTEVDVDTSANGSGSVNVTVTLDHAAAEAVGDINSQLQISDLTAAGWGVTGPVAGPNGSTVLEATHSFSNPAEASTLVAEIAGSGPAGSRPFQFSVVNTKSFWKTRTALSGTVDLRCDLACFGDSGLTKQLGFSTGVDPGSVASQQKDFTFGFSVHLAGTVGSSNASVRSGSELRWTPKLGQRTVLLATTSTTNETHVIGALVVAGLVVVLIVIAIVSLSLRRRRRRRLRLG
jgi:hypothetical protein